MRLFVTGANGVLGGRFVQAALDAGHEVVTLSRRTDQTDSEGVQRVVVRDMVALTPDDVPADLDAVVHFAVGRDGSDRQNIDASVAGARAVIAAARARQVRHFIHISSLSVYPAEAAPTSSRSATELDPRPEQRGGYAVSKTSTEAALYELADAGGLSPMQLTIVRPGLVYSSDLGSALWETATQLPLGLLLGHGCPTQMAPVVDVDDLNAGLLALLHTAVTPGAVRVYDALSRPSSKRAFLEVYRYLSGQPGRQVWLPRPLTVTLGKLFDSLSARRGRQTQWRLRAQYMYDFDAGRLPAADFWQAVGVRPEGDASSAIKQVITPDRAPSPGADHAEMIVQARARALLAVAANTTAGGAPGRAATDIILVGAGRIIEQTHVPALQALPAYRVRGVIDTNRARAAAIAHQFPGARVYADISDVEEHVWATATATIATPGHSHFALARDILRRGGALIIEKPVTIYEDEFHELRALGAASGRPITVTHNYRLLPNALRLWRFLETHDVGALVHANVVHHERRLSRGQPRWMLNEKRHRVLLMEQALHSLDIVVLLGGAINAVEHLAVTDQRHGDATLALTGAATLAAGATLHFDLSVAGTAEHKQITLEFERCVCEIGWYPNSFRVLPPRRNAFDDIAASLRQLSDFAGNRLRPTVDGLPKSALPHHALYRHHLAHLRGQAATDLFSLDGVADTMRSVYRLGEGAYKDLRRTALASAR